MEKTKEITTQIKKLEEQLLIPELRKSAEELSNILDPDFLEIGSSGKSYTRKDVIDSLKNESPAVITIKDFKIKILAEDIVIALYTASIQREETGGTISKRSSVWKREEGKWKIIFHQGTPIR